MHSLSGAEAFYRQACGMREGKRDPTKAAARDPPRGGGHPPSLSPSTPVPLKETAPMPAQPPINLSLCSSLGELSPTPVNARAGDVVEIGSGRRPPRESAGQPAAAGVGCRGERTPTHLCPASRRRPTVDRSGGCLQPCSPAVAAGQPASQRGWNDWGRVDPGVAEVPLVHPGGRSQSSGRGRVTEVVQISCVEGREEGRQ